MLVPLRAPVKWGRDVQSYDIQSYDTKSNDTQYNSSVQN
jgi:hypothetical protein